MNLFDRVLEQFVAETRGNMDYERLPDADQRAWFVERKFNELSSIEVLRRISDALEKP